MYGFLALLLTVLLLAFFSLCGVLVQKLVCKLTNSETVFKTKASALKIPLIGAASLICVTQTLNLLFPIRAVAIAFIPVLLCGAYVSRKELKDFFKTLIQNRFTLCALFFTAILTLLPCIRYNELLSLHFANNDIAYYLSSMEWLRDSSYFDKIDFTSAAPFNSLADFMLTTTRIGTDVLGALTLSYLPLEAHQIFLVLCAAFNCLCIISAAYVLKDVLGVTEKRANIVTLFLASGTAIVELTKQQYAPQILGVAFFIWFMGNVSDFFSEERNAYSIFSLALSAIAVISVYSEYASYAVILFVIAFAVNCFFIRNAKKSLRCILDALKMVAFAFIFNIPGFIIALRFNLDVIFSQISSLGNIDPYGGNIAGINTLIRYLFNADIDAVFAGKSVAGIALSSLFTAIAYAAIIVIVLLSAVAIVKALLRDRCQTVFYLLGALGFFGAYWLFFRSTRYAYGEYKHIHLILLPTIIILTYFADLALRRIEAPYAETTTEPKGLKIFKRTAEVSVACGLILLTVVNTIAFTVFSKSEHRFDSSMEEFKNAAQELVPQNATLGIANDLYFHGHAMVYALRNTDRSVSLLTNNSYYAYFVHVRAEYPQYIALPVETSGRYDDIFTSFGYELIWKNRAYCILKNELPVGFAVTSGFSAPNYFSDRPTHRYMGTQAEFVITNGKTEDQPLALRFKTAVSFDGIAKSFDVFIGDTLIGSGVAGEEFVSSEITLSALSEATVRIVVSGDPVGFNGMGIHSVNIQYFDVNESE